MQNLPAAAVYEKELKYMPWGVLINEIQNFVIKNAPTNGTIVDLFCGTGHLLGELQKKRLDIKYTGVDLEPEFIEFASNKYPNVEFITADASKWISDKKYNVVLCTGGLHHLPYKKQKSFIRKVSGMLKDNGFAVIGDPYICDFANERERKIAAVNLGCEYLIATIQNGAPDEIIKIATDLIENDVLLVEFKSSIKKIKPVFEKYFSNMAMRRTWPSRNREYGEYYFILRK